jgi:hypothetical protein
MKEQAGRWADLPLAEAETAVIDSKTGKQTLVYDLGAANRPVEQVIIRARTPEYARALRVYGATRRTASGDGWPTGNPPAWIRPSDVVLLNGFTFRYLKIEVFNHDDLPLDIEQATAQAAPRYLFFRIPGRPPSLSLLWIDRRGRAVLRSGTAYEGKRARNHSDRRVESP